MLNLCRNQAPVSSAAWAEIDAEAKRVLQLHLAGRKLVDFDGPHGWGFSAVPLGRTDALKSTKGIQLGKRRLQPLVELRVPFTLARAEIEAIDRGAQDAELDALVEAAIKLARCEDQAIFDGLKTADITGLATGSAHEPMTIQKDYTKYPSLVAKAVSALRARGVVGPYAIALGPRCWEGLNTASDDGYPTIKRVRDLVDGPVVWAPAVDGAVVMSMRGGDYQLTVGQDISIGYAHHDDKNLHLYMVESFTFQNLSPESALALRYR